MEGLKIGRGGGQSRTTDTQWRHKSKISEKLGQCGRQNILWPYLKIWEWEWIFGHAVKAISSLGIRSPWSSSKDCPWFMSPNLLVCVACLVLLFRPFNYNITKPWSFLCMQLLQFNLLVHTVQYYTHWENVDGKTLGHRFPFVELSLRHNIQSILLWANEETENSRGCSIAHYTPKYT